MRIPGIRDRLFWLLVGFSLFVLGLAYQIHRPYVIDVGGFFDRAYLESWYDPERSGNVSYRWSEASSFFYLPSQLVADGLVLRLRMETLPAAGEQDTEVSLLDGARTIERWAVGPGLKTYTVTVPSGSLSSAKLDLAAPTFQTEQDPREHGVKVDWIRLERAPASSPWQLPPVGPYLGGTLLAVGFFFFLKRLDFSTHTSMAGAGVLVSLLAATWALFAAEFEFLIPEFLAGLVIAHLALIPVLRYSLLQQDQRWYRLFGLGLVGALFLRVALTPSAGMHFDVEVWYLWWSERAITGGLEAVYSGYHHANLPPLFIYLFSALKAVYDAVTGTAANINPPLLVSLFHFPAIIADILIALAILLYHRAPRVAALSALAFLYAPPVLLDSGYSGRTSALYSLFCVVSFVTLARGWKTGPLVFLGIGSVVKPQPWIFAPILSLVEFRRNGLRAVVRDGLIGLLLVLLVMVPLVVTGALPAFLQAMSTGFQMNMNMLSANAYNFWWFISNGRNTISPLRPLSLFGLITLPVGYREAAWALFALVYLLALAAVSRSKHSNSTLLEAGALIGFAIYMFLTGMVDNYMLHVFPFLALVLFDDWRLVAVFGVLCLTSSANVLLESSYSLANLRAYLPDALLRSLRWYDSALSSFVMAFWLVSFVRRRLVALPRAPLAIPAPISVESPSTEVL